MNMTADSRPAIFTIEFPDGPVYTGKAEMASLSLSVEQSLLDVTLWGDNSRSYVPGLRSWEINLTGMGGLTETTGNDLVEVMKQQRAAPEWECPYCGQAWLRSHHKCWDGVNGCGANRPAVYGQ